MKLDSYQKSIVAVLLLFLFVQGMGLYLGAKLINDVNIPVESSAEAGVFLFVYIMVMTAVILVIIKFWRHILKLMEVLSVLFSTYIFFEIFFIGLIPETWAIVVAGDVGSFLALGLASIITFLRIVHPTLLTQNVAILLSIIGVGALLGASMGFLPAIILLGLLTMYDVIAVFQTKHMVTMAKEIVKQKLAFTMAIPTEDRVFQLGGGDLVMPMIFTIAVLREFGIVSAVMTVTGSMLFLVALFALLMQRPGRAWPALPPVTIGAILGWAVSIAFKVGGII